MAFKLTKQQQQALADYSAKINEVREALDGAVSAYNETLDQAAQEIDAAVTAYNEALDEARSFVEDLHSEFDSEYAERSEKWQDSDKGEQTLAWIESIGEASGSFDNIEFDPPEEIDLDNILNENHADLLDCLPHEPEGSW